MPVDLAAPIDAYFRATNQHDIETRLEQFAEHATVKDEDADHIGHAAIRAWMETTARKYNFTVEVQSARESDGRTIVAGLVSGNFPGSPVLLNHTFTVSGTKITTLEIEA